jgi:hypothetical protein
MDVNASFVLTFQGAKPINVIVGDEPRPFGPFEAN